MTILLMVLGVFSLETIHVLTLEESVYAHDGPDRMEASAVAHHDADKGVGLPVVSDVRDDDTVRIVALYGPRSLKVGELANFRARIANGSEMPVIYRWTLGDGTQAEGNNVSHRYKQSGRYLIVATARNDNGSDSDSLIVIVTGDEFVPIEPIADDLHQGDDGVTLTEPTARARPEPALSPREGAYRGSHPISWTEGGYTLLVATASDRETAETIGVDLRRRGLRSGIYLDQSGVGAAVYRVIVGQFADESEAVRVRKELLAEGYRGAFVVHPLPLH